jgi:DNA-binding response OmpR family regulator
MVKKILVVEDDEGVRKFIRMHLEFAGFHVVEASNGKEGLKKIEEEKPDLIITDIMMPEMDGAALYRKLKESKETSSIPILVLTVQDSFEEVHQAYQLGVDEYLTKPFDPKLLIQRIHEIFS